MESKDFSAKRLQRKIIVDQKRRRTGNNDRPPFTPIENGQINYLYEVLGGMLHYSRIPGVIRPMHLTQQARASGNMFDPGKENFKPMSSSCVTQSTTTPGVQLNNLNIWNKFTNTCNAPPNLYLTPQTPIIDYSSGVCSALTYQRTTGTVNTRPSINVANPLDTEHVPTRRGKHIIQSSTVLQFVQQNLHTDNCLTNINPQLRYMRSTSKTTEHATRSHSTISMGDCGSYFSPFQSSIPVEDSNTHSQYCHGESSSRQVVNEDIGSDNKHGDDIDDENDNHIQGEYWDIGDPEFECQYCGAQMWYGERLKKARRQKNPKFGLCCGQGKGKGPYTFRMDGQNYHKMGGLVPSRGYTPKFSQLYIYDTEEETRNRINAASKGVDNDFDPTLVNALKNMIDVYNPIAQSFRMAADRIQQGDCSNVKLRLIGRRSKDGRQYNLPTSSEVAAIIIGDINPDYDQRDIVVDEKSKGLQRINEYHPSYLAFQYPMLFTYGEDGFRNDVPHAMGNSKKKKNVTIREHLAYRIQDRAEESPTILLGRRLFHQFLVDTCTAMETQRLCFIRNNQKLLRADKYKNITDAKRKGKTNTSSIGKKFVLPSSHTGSWRWVVQNYQDAMAISRWTGFPDLFITFTCNPKWPEILRFCKKKGVKSEDRPDILCRVFKMKLDEMIKDLKERKMFGKPSAIVYTVEFQKRGLPHAHILLFLASDSKFHTAEDIDRVISAEIPDKETRPELYKVVSDYMVHGPCGASNPNSPCMLEKKKCSKMFPKRFSERTIFDEDGYPVYRRRNTVATIDKNGATIDNRYIVPYNAQLLLKYQAHINVEWCNQTASIKYLFKYINKGTDRTTFCLSYHGEDGIDEITEHQDGRYISACEAVWRILKFDINYRYPSVVRLSFHLENEQNMVFPEDEDIDDVVNRPSVGESQFLRWMDQNKIDEKARGLTYAEFPQHYVWNKEKRRWTKRNQRPAIGRIYHVSPNDEELYYLRILLNHVRGPKCYNDIKTFDGILSPTFKDACFARGLIDDEKEYILAIEEASVWGTGTYLRRLFCTLLVSKSMRRPEHVWENTWKHLSDDILHKQRKKYNNPDFQLSEEQVRNLALLEMEKILASNNYSLKDWKSMPFPDEFVVPDIRNRFIHDEISYDKDAMNNEHSVLYSKLTDEQMGVYHKIMSAVDRGRGGVFFLYGYGGTGKTFIWKTLCSKLRGRGDIVLPVASSGFASLLLPRGRTAHSRFSIPLDVHEESFCPGLSPGTDLSELLKRTKLIIWDEAPMTNKHCFEALDRSLKDIIRSPSGQSSQMPFGGLVVVFGGDFRQILPVVQMGSRYDIVHATITSSKIWESCEVLQLTRNMRLQGGSSPSEVEEIKNFAEWLLEVGNGTLGGENDGEADIKLPDDIIIKDAKNSIASIVESTYPSILQNMSDPKFFQERAILAPTNEMVEKINEYILSLMPGEEVEYLSSDCISKEEGEVNEHEHIYSTEFLNTVRCSGLPNHSLKLKVGCMVMLLRNIDQGAELCNGTRLIVTKLGKLVVEAKMLTGKYAEEMVYIPRTIMSPTDFTKFPVKFQRRQFPLAVCFAMTINKSQGQSLANVGLYLPKPVFSHGQLYVAFSRVTTKKGLKVLAYDKDGNISDTTTNVVYREIFNKL
ncbi:hypothetical protein OROGR_001321 [Orobanche gracilis]